MAMQKLSTYTVKLKESTTWDTIFDTILSFNSKQSHCIINEQGNTYIGGCYIYESMQNETIYNITENKFETITVPKQNVVKFDVFTQNNTLFLWGNKKASMLFITALEQSSNNTIVIDYNETDFKVMIKRLMRDQSVSFTRMKIVDVIIDEGIVATCSVNLVNHDNSIDLVNKYIDSIAQISVAIGTEIQPVSITLYSSGSVTVFKDRDDIDGEVMNSINLMIGGVM